MKTYSLNELIKNGLEPEIINLITNEILNITLPITDDYPEYKTWFLTKHLAGIGINRDILFTTYKKEIVGIANIKFSEQKICTLYIKPGFRENKIGRQLVKTCMDKLGTNKPLITISSNKIHLFKKIIKENNWEYSESLGNYYTIGSDEFIFNGSLYLPKQKETEYQKIILPKKPNYYHISIPMPKRIIFFIKQILSQN